MNREGPTLEHLLRRLAEAPSDFLAEPWRPPGRGTVHVHAVVGDLLALHGVAMTDATRWIPDGSGASVRRAGVALLLCWLLADDRLLKAGTTAAALVSLLSEGAGELAGQNPAATYRDDPERREELVRFTLARLDMRPAGETIAQASDRLTTLSSIERNRVLAASRKAEERARAIREALVRKAAQESADKYTRE
ncbi:hypothetical protein [Haloferula sargassicola]|uniref:Uncharacterized protein n=1 Tax=Haloferula sargassicola TaxID=490096 RepID=A0ABP9US75_9BACT